MVPTSATRRGRQDRQSRQYLDKIHKDGQIRLAPHRWSRSATYGRCEPNFDFHAEDDHVRYQVYHPALGSRRHGCHFVP